MNFDFTSDQYQFRDTFRDFLARDFPLARAIECGQDAGARQRLQENLASMGLFSLLVPEEHGGMGLGFIDLALLLEELGSSLATPTIFDTLLAVDLLANHGTAAQQARWLPGLSSGELQVALAVAEAPGYDPAWFATTLSADSSELKLNGQKLLVPQLTEVNLLMVVVAASATRPASIVCITPTQAGVSSRQHSTLDLTAPYFQLSFDNVVVAEEDLLVDDGRAVARLYDAAASSAALQLAGIAGRMLTTAVDYANARVQFGKPIGSFQAIKHRCADMAMKVESGRTAAYYAAWAVAASPEDRPRATSIAKSYCGDAAQFACNQGTQIHGGMGFTWELGLHFYLRRAKALHSAWGDADYHRERLLAEVLHQRGLGGAGAAAGLDAGQE